LGKGWGDEEEMEEIREQGSRGVAE